MSLPFAKSNNKTCLPLLDNDEMLDLLRAVQNMKYSIAQKYDIAHRHIGDHRSIYRGHGMDYEESRHYQAGDDPRNMNWQLTARTGQHYMKIFREERQPGIFILVDRRQPMRFATRTRLKITQAARAAAVAGFAAQEHNRSIGGVILDQQVQWFKESQKKQAVFDFIHRCARSAPVTSDTPATNEPVLGEILKMLNVVLTRGSTVYLISDFHDLDEHSQSSLRELSASHTVKAVQICDPAELHLPEAGTLLLKSDASSKPVSIDTNSRADREKYYTAAVEYYASKKNLFENNAINYQQILTTTDAIAHVLKI